MREFEDMRRKQISQFGPMTFDHLIVRGVCGGCKRPVLIELKTDSVAERAFESMSDFVDSSARALSDMFKGAPALDCAICNSPLKPISAEYYFFDSASDHDVVLRWSPKTSFFGKPATELFTLARDGELSPLGKASPEQEARIVHDSAFRNAFATFATDPVEQAILGVERLSATYPADPLLLVFVPIMLKKLHARVSWDIARNHEAAHPGDSEGHYWIGEILTFCFNHRTESLSRVPEARAALQRALELRPDHLPAALSLCSLFQLEGRTSEAKDAYSKLLITYPNCMQAHFNLATMLLETDPATSLEHFRRGERLAPEDPDFPVGCVRALLALGRTDEAREALKRARNTTDHHPRFAELEAHFAAR